MVCLNCKKDEEGVGYFYGSHESFPLCWGCFNRIANMDEEDRHRFLEDLLKREGL